MAGHTPGHSHGYVIVTKDNQEIRRKSGSHITQDTLSKIAALLGVPAAETGNIATILLGNLEDDEFD